MVTFSDLSIAQLKKIIKLYRSHILKDITSYIKKEKNELITLCEKMFQIHENSISLKTSEPIQFDIPKGKNEVKAKNIVKQIKKIINQIKKNRRLKMERQLKEFRELKHIENRQNEFLKNKTQ